MISVGELLAMGVWFSASAVIGLLTTDWGLDAGARAWLTMTVQAGFVAGAILSAVLNLADRIAGPKLMAVSTFLAALCTALIPAFDALAPALVLRFLTGFFVAGVYPVGMKIVSTWTRQDRGLGIGLLVGALNFGTAMPHLLNALGGVRAWQPVLYLAAGLAALGGVIVLLFIREGPYKTVSPPFNARYVVEIFRKPELVLANLGYLGHMWELFAMWTWIAVFFTASYARVGISATWASLSAFVVISLGGIASVLAGKFADSLGRTTLTILAMSISALCSLVIGLFFGGSPWPLLIIGLIWGFTIVPDSAQFSAAISELCQKEYTGTALTIQTSLGFLLTLITIRLTPTLEAAFGWRWAFAFLALGPLVGIWAMSRLRRSDRAQSIAQNLNRQVI